MTFKQAVKFAGNQVKLAEMLGVSKGAITNIKRRGSLPWWHQDTIEEKSGGKLKADRREK